MTKQLVKLHYAIITCVSCFILAISPANASELSFKSSILSAAPTPATKASITANTKKEASTTKTSVPITDGAINKALLAIKIAQPIKPVIKPIVAVKPTPSIKDTKVVKANALKKISQKKTAQKPVKKAVQKSKLKIKKSHRKTVKKSVLRKTKNKSLKATKFIRARSMIQRLHRKKRQTIHPALLKRLMAHKNLRKGDPIFIRIFKKEGELELWMRSGRRFSLLKTYDICKFSGQLGPKLAENDRQSPEGFYSVNRRQMKPDSAYYRAFNIGYPNKFDRSWGRTGSLIMVHGACKSVGCFAMTNKVMGEIYNIADAALSQNQKNFQVHIFPFRLTAANMDRYKKHRWSGYWWNLKRGYDMFEQSLLPPITSSKGRLYTFSWPKEPQPIKRKPIISWNTLGAKAKRTSQTH